MTLILKISQGLGQWELEKKVTAVIDKFTLGNSKTCQYQHDTYAQHEDHKALHVE